MSGTDDPPRRRPRAAAAVPAPPEAERVRRPVAAASGVPFLLDFYPLQSAKETRVSGFFDALRQHRFTTTRCRRDGQIAWPPRSVCPKCHTEELEWVDLPTTGRLYAFSAVLAGAPLGMEAEVPFVVGLVDLDGASLRVFGRIVGATWEECRIGDPVTFESFDLPDGRVFYRFRHAPAAPPSARERSL